MPEDDSKDQISVLDDQESASGKLADPPPVIVPPVLNPPIVPMPQPRPRPHSYHSERRRSITDRYSSIMLPALKEEKTPVATPEGSLRLNSTAAVAHPSVHDLHESLASIAPSHEQAPEEMINLQDEPSIKSTDIQTNQIEVDNSNVYSPVSPLDRLVSIRKSSQLESLQQAANTVV
jgi:hypothetical protein